MAHARHLQNRQQPSMLTGIGQKVQQAAEIAGTLKGIYDVGSALYQGFQYAAPIVSALI